MTDPLQLLKGMRDAARGISDLVAEVGGEGLIEYELDRYPGRGAEQTVQLMKPGEVLFLWSGMRAGVGEIALFQQFTVFVRAKSERPQDGGSAERVWLHLQNGVVEGTGLRFLQTEFVDGGCVDPAWRFQRVSARPFALSETETITVWVGELQVGDRDAYGEAG